MVLLGRIELPTSSLPMTRSTTELQVMLLSKISCNACSHLLYNCTPSAQVGQVAHHC